jgi:glutathione S-transferase
VKPRLFIGNKKYSSWSLRPWLVLRWAGIEFDEVLINLDAPGYGEQANPAINAVSPNGRVPVLHFGDEVIWDSLAIAEWAAERVAAARLWPSDAAERALARSAVAEMHSGFAALRTHLPMNVLGRFAAQDWNTETRRDVTRIERLWTSLRERFAARGPWLCGERGIVDAFYAPVVTRFRTYSVALSPALAAYADTLLSDAAFAEWETAARAEMLPTPQISRAVDRIYP